VSVWFS